MIETYNILDSYKYFRKEKLKVRLKTIIKVHTDTPKAPKIHEYNNEGKRTYTTPTVRKLDSEDIDKYKRLPVKLIERYEKHYDISPKPEVDRATYIAIVNGYMKFIMRNVLEGHEVRLGAKLGIICIRGKKVFPEIDWKGDIKGIAPNWAKTKEQWTKEAEKLGMTFKEYIEKIPKKDRKLVYCFNEHSDYVKYIYVWFKRNVIVKNKIYYGLKFNRTNRRMIWKLVNEGKQYLITE